MSFTTKRMGAKRLVVYDLLKRTREYHAPMMGMWDWDVTDTRARIAELRAAGKHVSLAAFLIKATATVVAATPRLRARMFHGFRGPFEAQFAETSANIVVHRHDGDGGRIFPVVLRDVNERSVLEIAADLVHYRTAPLEEIPEAMALDELDRLPRLLMKLHDYKVRSDPAYFIKRFGTFGVSTVIHRNSGGVGGAAPSAGTVFFPMRIEPRPAVVDGAVVPRELLLFGANVDHQILDGLETVQMGLALKPLIEEPDRLLGDL